MMCVNNMPLTPAFPPMDHRWKPNVTVAAIIEQDSRFLLVEEHTSDGLRLNNPAGHLDRGETPAQACVRETLEETAHDFTPTALVGIYLSRQDSGGPNDITYLRFAFCGQVGRHHQQRALDTGIVRAVWMGLDEVRASRSRHRSAMVLQGIDDYVAGRRFALDLVHSSAIEA